MHMLRGFFRGILLLGVLMVLAGCGGGEQSDDPGDTSPPPVVKCEKGFALQDDRCVPERALLTGTLVGEVRWVGAIPPRHWRTITKDVTACGDIKPSEALVIGSDSGIRWVVVSLQSDRDLEGAVATEPPRAVELNQRGCNFSPHVLLVRPGAEVKILNPDGITHNFHTFSKDNPPVNKAQPKFKKEMVEVFQKPEIIQVLCDVHGWMSGWIVVQEHPWYAITDAKGRFRIEGVPAGKRVLRVWHETLEETVLEVNVTAGVENKVPPIDFLPRGGK